MYRIRSTRTKSNSIAIQVVKYEKRQTVVLKHIGSSKEKKEIDLFKIAAKQWIKKNDPQLSLFANKPVVKVKDKVLVVDQSKLISTHKMFTYEVFYMFLKKLGFIPLLEDLKSNLLFDLVIARLINPASKLESIYFLEKEFNIKYTRSNVYRSISKYIEFKDKIEKIIIDFAKKKLSFNFKVVYYDVSTLYFESFKSDEELKQCGFSKDNKFNQPQLVIGLVVNNQGFPVSYQLFPGNTFEGSTFIPVIKHLQQKYKIETFTVVADAAMISEANVKKLKDKKLKYIVGARLANLDKSTIGKIDEEMIRTHNSTIRLKTKKGYLICHFSKSRFSKDKHETGKQVAKAMNALQNQGEAVKRLKFIKKKKKKNEKIIFNKKLFEKTKILWGIKGYYTNLKNETNKEIINQYRQLWKVEKAFRITKSDLQARPIYHRNTDTIKTHILICFMALSIAKYIEIQTDLSLKKTLQLLATVKDAKIKNELTGNIITMRSTISKDVNNFLDKCDLSY